MSSGYVVAGLVGVGIAVQVAVVGRASSGVHPLAVSLGLMVSGVAAATLWAALAGAWPDVASVVRFWWWVPLGVGGWIVVAALGYASARIGVASVLTVSVGAQLITALGLDTATGSAPVGLRSALGAALVVAGAAVSATAA